MRNQAINTIIARVLNVYFAFHKMVSKLGNPKSAKIPVTLSQRANRQKFLIHFMISGFKATNALGTINDFHADNP